MTDDNMVRRVQIRTRTAALEGCLAVPAAPRGVVLFVHGSGSSRHSPRNRYVAQALQQDHIATLLFDLLTPEEDSVYENRFDIELLAHRLMEAVAWLRGQPPLTEAAMGFFGASTGAAAALRAAAHRPARLAAVVSRGGRADLAMSYLGRVPTPTLLIVGELDDVVLELNQQAYMALAAQSKELTIVPGATHLFEEPGALEVVTGHARRWFTRFLV